MAFFLPHNMSPKARARFGFIRAACLIVLGSVFLLMASLFTGLWQILWIIMSCGTLLVGYAYALFGVCGLWHEQECAEPTGVFAAEVLGNQVNSPIKKDVSLDDKKDVSLDDKKETSLFKK